MGIKMRCVRVSPIMKCDSKSIQYVLMIYDAYVMASSVLTLSEELFISRLLF